MTSETYDYVKQAWVRDGKYVRCGHPLVMDCGCFGKLHAGESVHEIHQQDTDCTVDGSTNLCLVCGVEHADPCLVCQGRGFHKPECLLLAPVPTSHDAHEKCCNCEECGAPICICLVRCLACQDRLDREAEAEGERWHEDREPESGRYFAQ
jgi:hypothetical protein